MQNLETYLLYPIYEISIDNGYYDDIEFINILEKKLNNIDFQKFNYFKKQLEVVDITNELINNPDDLCNFYKQSYPNPAILFVSNYHHQSSANL